MLLCNEWVEFCEKRLDACRPPTIRSMHALVEEENADVAEALRQSGDDGFLEPLLFAYLHATRLHPEGPSTIELPQIALGHVVPELRPESIPVHADDTGTIYVPEIGYFVTHVRNEEMALIYHRESRSYSPTTTDGSDISFAFHAPLRVPGTEIEIMQRGNPLMDAVFMRNDGTATGTPLGKSISCRGQSNVAPLGGALDIIREKLSFFHRLLTRTTRRLFVFDEPSVDSFARMPAHGVVFLNETQGVREEPFFLYELVCRGTITLFNAMSPRPRDYFHIDPNQTLDQFAIRWGGDRNVYTGLHGMFYECLMTLAMDHLHHQRVFSGRMAHEVLGRLAYLHSRFRSDIHDLMVRGDILSDLGRDFYGRLTRQIEILRARRAALPSLDLRNQLGLFDYAGFAELNPCPPS